MFDYIKIGPSNSGFESALMGVDKMSKLVVFTPVSVASAIPASRAIMDWGSRYGLPEWIISDGGRHLANHALRLMEE